MIFTTTKIGLARRYGWFKEEQSLFTTDISRQIKRMSCLWLITFGEQEHMKSVTRSGVNLKEYQITVVQLGKSSDGRQCWGG